MSKPTPIAAVGATCRDCGKPDDVGTNNILAPGLCVACCVRRLAQASVRFYRSPRTVADAIASLAEIGLTDAATPPLAAALVQSTRVIPTRIDRATVAQIREGMY